MSAIFESLKKSESKGPSMVSSVSKAPPRNLKTNVKLVHAWSIWGPLILAVAVGGFAFFAHGRYQELNRLVASDKVGVSGQLGDLTNRIRVLGEQLESIQTTHDRMAKQFDRLASDFAKDRTSQNKMAEQIRSTDKRSKDLQTQFGERFDILSARINTLEKSKQS